MNNSTAAVVFDLCGLITRIAECALNLDQKAVKFLGPGPPKWLQSPLLDIKTIQNSFEQNM
jgi:hypothetical protein